MERQSHNNMRANNTRGGEADANVGDNQRTQWRPRGKDLVRNSGDPSNSGHNEIGTGRFPHSGRGCGRNNMTYLPIYQNSSDPNLNYGDRNPNFNDPVQNYDGPSQNYDGPSQSLSAQHVSRGPRAYAGRGRSSGMVMQRENERMASGNGIIGENERINQGRGGGGGRGRGPRGQYFKSHDGERMHQNDTHGHGSGANSPQDGLLVNGFSEMHINDGRNYGGRGGREFGRNSGSVYESRGAHSSRQGSLVNGFSEMRVDGAGDYRGRGGRDFGRNNGGHRRMGKDSTWSPPSSGPRGNFQNPSSSRMPDDDAQSEGSGSAPIERKSFGVKKSGQDWRINATRRETSESKTTNVHINGSNLPQLVQELEDKLSKGRVECMICYDRVGRSAAIWSCGSCYSIFHMHCTRKWARTPTSVDLTAQKGQGTNWRCPGCQSVQLTSPEDLHYTCFCEKVRDPDVEHYLIPHSCGGPCGKPLGKSNKNCPHVCTLQCHPGPCPPCTAMAPPQQCPCGRSTFTRRCSDTKSVESCGKLCEKLLNCERHNCDQVCHLGPCNPCKVLVNASCFCGATTEVILCGDMDAKGELEWMKGVFSCPNSCTKMLSCGNHKCGKKCHPGECGVCELSPSEVKACPCGKTQLLNKRTSCLDPIPTCSSVCGRILPCGKHSCDSKCHQGSCGPCNVSVTQKCRCGTSTRNVPCWETTESSGVEFTCGKTCGRKKNCGRHRCNEKCCPLASDKCLSSYTGDWDPHLCQIPCGKKLRCGQHSCEELCHKGHCPPCLETAFTDLTCACGMTSIPPPIPCGTPLPVCNFNCPIPQPCGHAPNHNCHFGECPSCTVPVPKECVGGHLVLNRVACGSKDIRCNNLCGKPRQCGMHACARQCHLPPCETSAEPSSSSTGKRSCGQTCGAPRRDCKHACVEPCHPLSPCPDMRCIAPVTITCACGRLTAKVPCDSGGNITRHDPILEAAVLSKLPTPLQPLQGTTGRVPLSQRNLTCSNECARSEKKKILADAFGVSTTVDILGVDGTVAELLADYVRRDSQWILSIEERFKYLIQKAKSEGGVTVHVFSPVPKEKREVMRHIAERWNLSVFSAGWEPKRFLVVQATNKSKIPARTIVYKPPTPGSQVQSVAPPFDASVDMDPRLVLAMFDIPRDADINVLILRFGGECELVWLNDKNALTIFTDPGRATAALRRIDHASKYYGACSFNYYTPTYGPSSSNTKGGGMVSKSNAWKNNVKEVDWVDDSWGQNGAPLEVSGSVWKFNKPIAPSKNTYGALAGDTEQVFAQAEASSSKSLHAKKSEDSSHGIKITEKRTGNDDLESWEDALE